MEDRFKFRIPMFTDKDHFSEFQYIELGDEIECTLCGHNGEPQQCTGLKDKNGKLIYEGDIVREYFGETGTYQVMFCKYTAKFEFVNLNDEDYDWQMFAQQYEGMSEYEGISTDLEIIGNIYENPKLLESKND